MTRQTMSTTNNICSVLTSSGNTRYVVSTHGRYFARRGKEIPVLRRKSAHIWM